MRRLWQRHWADAQDGSVLFNEGKLIREREEQDAGACLDQFVTYRKQVEKSELKENQENKRYKRHCQEAYKEGGCVKDCGWPLKGVRSLHNTWRMQKEKLLLQGGGLWHNQEKWEDLMSVKKYRQMCNVLSRRFWMFKQDWIKNLWAVEKNLVLEEGEISVLCMSFMFICKRFISSDWNIPDQVSSSVSWKPGSAILGENLWLGDDS